MRDVIFRGKRTDNGEWVEGNLFIPDKSDTPTQICVGTNVIRITYDIDPETVGQYTSLTDKNGNKIFESDVLRLTELFCNRIAIVRFIGSAFCACDNICNLQVSESMEVIGNIYDNQDLLMKVGETE